MLEAGRLKAYPSGTRVRVLGKSVTARFVKVTVGDDAGQSGWIYSRFIRRETAPAITAGAPVPARAPDPDPVPVAEPARRVVELKSQSDRAFVILQMGKTLQERGKRKSALEYYQRVVTEFPDTPAARDAAVRIKAMGSK
jgi:hypothetical protein